jgi:hypothetical protein
VNSGVDIYEYCVHFWGAAEDVVMDSLESDSKYHWFATKKESDDFVDKIRTIAEKHSKTLAVNEVEGFDVRYKTIAHILLKHPNGNVYKYVDDFGYGYPDDGVYYQWEEGNYSCDCNRSSFLSREHPEVEELDCGETIEMVHLEIEKERQ